MMKRISSIALLFSLCLFAQAQTVNPDYADGRIWFRLKADYRLSASLNENPRNVPVGSLPFLESLAKDHSFSLLSRPFFAAKSSPALQRTYELHFADIENVEVIISRLRQSGAVEYAEKVPLLRSCLTPNDPSYASQWHLSRISAAAAWNSFSTGSTIVIAIVDDAVQRNHPDLQGNVWVNPGEIANNSIDDDNNGYVDDINGYDVASNDNNPDPPSNSFDHGTHVAGISSAVTNNGAGIASIGFSCKLMCVKSTTQATVVTNGYDGIVYAVASGADVINMSWGGTGNSQTAQSIISWANSEGVVLIAAAGNNNVNTQFYPAAYTEVIAVAATNNNDTKASFSNYGNWVDISAPGNNIYSTLPGSTYGNKSGTSMASPLVAGLAGLMLSLNPALTPTDIRNCLSSTAININSLNPSYSGQLGSGRIEADDAMNCVAATLNWLPVADFIANQTNITAGGSILFTDLSTYNPSSWSWTFTGGTPASFNGQTPPAILYNTPGTYAVSLTVSNANGSDTETRNTYITVGAATGCTKLNYPPPSGWHPINYYTGATVGADGWVNGVNLNDDKEKAMYFDASSNPYTTLVYCAVAFGRAYSANPNKVVTLKIYDGTSGSPGALLGSATTTMGTIMNDEANSQYTDFYFNANPITLPASKKFFASIDLTNLCWNCTPKDTLNIVSNTDGETTPSVIWEKQSTSLWYRYTTAGTWNLSASLYMHPFLTNANVVATMTPPDTAICQGAFLNFDATGSTANDTLVWEFWGGTPFTANTLQQSVNYSVPGTYRAVVYVVGGGCSMLDSAEVTITVNPNPVVSVSATQSTICAGASTTLTATGASNYSWSPSNYLNTTTGPVVIATPPSNMTYTVTVTDGNNCTSNTFVNINVDDPPTASISVNPTYVCVGQPVTYDGSGSSFANNFSWQIPGGTPSSSNTSSPTVTYSSLGLDSATLIVSNGCGADTLVSAVVNVGCLGTYEDASDSRVFFRYDNSGERMEIIFLNSQLEGSMQLSLINQLGQMVLSREIPVLRNGKTEIPLSGFAAGMYQVRLQGNANSLSGKILVW